MLLIGGHGDTHIQGLCQKVENLTKIYGSLQTTILYCKNFMGTPKRNNGYVTPQVY